MTFYPDHLDVKASPDELIEAIKQTFKYWLMLHTDAETWASEWTQDSDPSIVRALLQNGISNQYFSFDVKSATINKWVEDNASLFCQCSNCECISEWGFEECNCDDEDDIESDWNDVDLESLKEWFENVGGLSDENLIPLVLEVLETEGFATYRQFLEDYTWSVEEDCQNAIDSIENAFTNQDRLVAALSAIGINHVNGQILPDYGNVTGLDYNDVENLCQNGLQAFFNDDTIQEWLEE